MPLTSPKDVLLLLYTFFCDLENRVEDIIIYSVKLSTASVNLLEGCTLVKTLIMQASPPASFEESFHYYNKHLLVDSGLNMFLFQKLNIHGNNNDDTCTHIHLG